MEGAEDLDALVRRVDPDRWLASRFIADRAKRADVIAIYAYDHELSRAEKVASNTLIAEIRLTWWREVLDEIFALGISRAHPVAKALARAVRRHDLPREPLEAMIDARIEALGGVPADVDAAIAWSDAVGGSATMLASRVLDPASAPDAARLGGRAWGLLMLRRSGAVFDAALGEAITLAKAEARNVSPAAFPSIAAASLASGELERGRQGGLETRLRLLWSVASGRL